MMPTRRHLVCASIALLALGALAAKSWGESTENWTPQLWREYLEQGAYGELPDFSYAGYHRGKREIPDVAAVADVTTFGAIPNDGADDTAAIQSAIDWVGEAGGGALTFPPGRFDINTTGSQYLRIDHSGVVLRGAGSATTGTIVNLRNSLLDTAETNAASALACITVGAGVPSEWTTKITDFKADALRGDREFQVNDASSLSPGDCLFIPMRDTAVDTENPAPEKTDLCAKLIAPLDIDPAWTSTYSLQRPTGWFVQVESVPTPDRIRLVQPFRTDHLVKWEAKTYLWAPLTEVGVEKIRFESEWEGGYAHHLNDDVDYGWTAVELRNTLHGWVRDCVFHDYTRAVFIRHSKNVTVRDIALTGKPGHHGVLMTTRAHDNLVERVAFDSPRTHTFTISYSSTGNVCRDSTINYGFDQAMGTGQFLDFHTGFPLENLFENIENAFVDPGGSGDNYPHCARRNVFWNIAAQDMNTRHHSLPNTEFLVAWQYSEDDWKYFPGSIVLGVYGKNADLTIDESAADRRDEWLIIEGLNRPGIQPASLSQTQLDIRLGRLAPGQNGVLAH